MVVFLLCSELGELVLQLLHIDAGDVQIGDMVEWWQHFATFVGYGIQVFKVDDVLLTGLNE